MREATAQAAYDGAALVFTRNQALSYLGKPRPLGHAEITTFATDGTNINFYAHYATLGEDGRIEYYQHQYASANITDTCQGYKDGRRRPRNAKDHAREQLYALRGELKERWKQGGRISALALQHITKVDPLPVLGGTCEERNGDEDDAGRGTVEQLRDPTPVV
ncbi:hypothetical protein ACJZ2D_012568 [Fusarium nematophilum]